MRRPALAASDRPDRLMDESTGSKVADITKEDKTIILEVKHTMLAESNTAAADKLVVWASNGKTL